MIHYHGTPITPREKMIAELQGRCFCVRYGEHRDVAVCHEMGQSVMLDNGAYSFWTKGAATDWRGYYQWVEPWLDFRTTWAVIPDVIDGTEEDNDRLLVAWFQTRLPRGAPVWHMHESLERLRRLCHGYERVCVGSSGEYADPASGRWRRRMEAAMDVICGNGPAPTWLHMLRAMSQAAGGPYPFASADSTNLARNHAGSWRQRPRSLRALADEVDARQAPARWRLTLEQQELVA